MTQARPCASFGVSFGAVKRIDLMHQIPNSMSLYIQQHYSYGVRPSTDLSPWEKEKTFWLGKNPICENSGGPESYERSIIEFHISTDRGLITSIVLLNIWCKKYDIGLGHWHVTVTRPYCCAAGNQMRSMGVGPYCCLYQVIISHCLWLFIIVFCRLLFLSSKGQSKTNIQSTMN